LCGDGTQRKQGAYGFKNDAVLGLRKLARAQGLNEILAQIARDSLIAQRAQCAKFSC
jgi:hypothetical protein